MAKETSKQQTAAPSELKAVVELAKELADNGQTVDQAIGIAEQRLKLLRGLRQAVAGAGEATPRTRKARTHAAAADASASSPSTLEKPTASA